MTKAKNKKQKLKQKLLTQCFSGFIAIHFFNILLVFLNVQHKQALRKLSDINYTYRLYLVLVIRIYFDKNLIYPETQAARILAK